MKGLLNFKSCLFLSVGLLGMACGPSGPVQEQLYQGGALGTSYSIKLFTPDSTNLQPAIDSVFHAVNHSLSTYIPDSDISRINRGEETVVVDAMFREVYNASGEVYSRTNGYFDPTVGILVDAWGFGPGEALEMDSTRVDSLLRYVGFDKIRLDAEGRIIREVPGVRLDFNAIAKGYAVDRLGIMLEGYGVEDYLVEVGGELRTKGANQAKNSPWVVGIDDPQQTEGRTIKKIISFTNRSMASSGNYRKFWIDSITGEKFVHTIDPHTGFTKNSNILATSVLAETCMEADAYATAFMAMELEDSKKLLRESPGLEGYIIYLGAGGNTMEFMTPGFKDLVR
jgi:thiamine biosynthesis lipoprotein